MYKLLPLLLAATTLSADTIVTGNSTFDAGMIPYNTDTSFNLTLSGGAITTFDVFHGYQQGAKGNSNQNFTSSFSFQPVPAIAIGIIGIATDFVVVVNGVTYAQGFTSPAGSIVPPDGSIFAANFTFTPISGTNVIDTTQNSTANGLFAFTGTVSATINGVTSSDPFSGYASFAATNQLQTPPFGNPLLTEAYSFSATAPEPATIVQALAGLGVICLFALSRRDP